MGTRHNAILALVSGGATEREVAQYKAAQCVAAFSGLIPRAIALRAGVVATITAIEALANDDAVSMTVSVMDGLTNITPRGLNPWIVYNPPMMVPGAGGDVSLGGRLFREDPEEVLVDLITQKLAQ